MREILFRGIDEGTQEWVYGYYCERPSPFHIGKEYSIFDDKTISRYTIRPETVGQYTGLTDKNGRKIFEGDIVHCWGGEYAFGFWEHNNTFAFTDISDYMQMGELSESEFVEIIGNIHDNPDLLKGGDM